jgi:V8-like Glu-specific endopeptidase
MEGESLHKDLKGQIVLLTNAHVISNSDPEALKPEEVIVTLEAVDNAIELKVEKIFWSSPKKELDVSILLFEMKSHDELKRLKRKITYYSISKGLPSATEKDRVYIIGHPLGGPLQISLQDNVFLGNNETYLHYRAPTEPGSSGSPVFNQNWDLIGIHHSGKDKMQKLDGSGEIYEANEGIWIKTIIEKIPANPEQ